MASRRRDRRGHDRLRHGDRQGRHPLRLPLQPAQEPGELRPGDRPRRARRQAVDCEMLACADDAVTWKTSPTATPRPPRPSPRLLDDVSAAGAAFDVSTYDLSGDHDIRPLVVETLLTYLELEGILESTGPFYTEYKFKPSGRRRRSSRSSTRPRRLPPAGPGASRRRRRSGSAIDVQRRPRRWASRGERIIAALNYLEEQGDLTLEVAGVRQGYRLLRAEPDRAAWRRRWRPGSGGRGRGSRAGRPGAGIRRAGRMPDAATAGLLRRDRLDADCGHCDWCLGERRPPLPSRRARDFGPAEVEAARSGRRSGTRPWRRPGKGRGSSAACPRRPPAGRG